MLKYVGYDIVFQEVPDEVTLAINLSNCPHRCFGCHSPHLQNDIGEILTKKSLSIMLQKYSKGITCVCFMGGDAAPDEVCRLAAFVKTKFGDTLKTAWYSGCQTLDKNMYAHCFNFIKFGPYIQSMGGLDRKTTNQRLYRVENGILEDITVHMQ